MDTAKTTEIDRQIDALLVARFMYKYGEPGVDNDVKYLALDEDLGEYNYTADFIMDWLSMYARPFKLICLD